MPAEGGRGSQAARSLYYMLLLRLYALSALATTAAGPDSAMETAEGEKMASLLADGGTALTADDIDRLAGQLRLLRHRLTGMAAPPDLLPPCKWEAPIVNGSCVDPCPACLGYPADGSDGPGYPESEKFRAWGVFSRPYHDLPVEDVATSLGNVDENPAQGRGDSILVQGEGVLYLSTDAGR